MAIEALKERYPLSKLAKRFSLHPNQRSQWKQDFLSKASLVFEHKEKKQIEPEVDIV